MTYFTVTLLVLLLTWPLYWHRSLIAMDMLQDGLQPVKFSEVISLGIAPDGYRPGRKIHFSLVIKAFFSFGPAMAKIYTKAIKFTNIPLS